MTNSVFSTMQDIENVATDIIKSYDNEIYTYKAVSQEELEKLEKVMMKKSRRISFNRKQFRNETTEPY